MSRRRADVHVVVALATVGVLASSPIGAHHSFAPYEPNVQIKLSGIVTEFRWANPHAYIELDAEDATAGQKKHWLIECASTSILNRAGWRFNMLKPGDRVTLIVSPLRNGEPAALLKQITLADGRQYSNGAAAGRVTIP